MIILRKLATATTTTEVSTSVLVAGDLIGAKDGLNKNFLTEYTYEYDRITIYYNGQALHSPTDFYQTGHNRITFVYLSPDSTDTIKTTYQTSTRIYQDLDLRYNNGVWESSASDYESLPSSMKVYVNGLKQNDDYYQAVINSGKIEVSFGFYTSASDWVNIEAPMLDNQDLVFDSNTWSTSGGSYTTTTSGSQVYLNGESYTTTVSGLQVYLNGKKHNSDYYTTTVSGGEIEVIFDSITSSNDWVNLDVPTSDLPQDISLVYSSGSWQTQISTFMYVPREMDVYVNGIKQNHDYYIAIEDSGKIKVIFDFVTIATDWVSILILQ